MSQFGLPGPNDNVLEERIEWDSISNWQSRRCLAYWKRGSSMNKTGNEAPR